MGRGNRDAGGNWELGRRWEPGTGTQVGSGNGTFHVKWDQPMDTNVMDFLETFLTSST